MPAFLTIYDFRKRPTGNGLKGTYSPEVNLFVTWCNLVLGRQLKSNSMNSYYTNGCVFL